jgi:cyclomaltodextrinase
LIRGQPSAALIQTTPWRGLFSTPRARLPPLAYRGGMTDKMTMPGLESALVYEVAVRNYGPKGTLRELTDDLDRIRTLGVDILYLQPIYPISVEGRKGRDGSLYAIADYRAVRHELGTQDDLRQLFERAHAAGLRVLMDIVFNHTGCDSVLARDHPDWFMHDAQGRLARKFDDWWDIYDLDFSKPDLRAELTDVLHQWVDLGADGVRCDTAPMVPLDFWVAARESFGGREMVWIAETLMPSFISDLRGRGFRAHADAEMYQAFDLTYDHDGYECRQAYLRGEIELGEYLRFIAAQPTALPAGALKLRFLENHDWPRIASLVTSPSGLRNWTLFNLLLPGATMISAGQEVALSVQASLFDQERFPWASGDPAFERFLTSAAALAKRIKGACSTFEVGELARGVVRLTWSGGDGRYLAILNLEDRYGEIELPEPVAGQELLAGTPVSLGPRCQIQKEPLLIQRAD